MKRLTFLFMISLLGFLIIQYWYFQNHEPYYAINISIENDEKYVGTFPADETFIAKKVWPELLKITKANPKLKIPQIVILDEDSQDKYKGLYHGASEKIEIFEWQILQDVSYFYSRDNRAFRYQECSVSFLNTVAHELLHYLYSFDPNDQYISEHERMLETGSMSKISQFIEKETKSDGLSRQIEEKILSKVVANEREEHEGYLLDKKSP